jgi:hypothetical protein
MNASIASSIFRTPFRGPRAILVSWLPAVSAVLLFLLAVVAYGQTLSSLRVVQSDDGRLFLVQSRTAWLLIPDEMPDGVLDTIQQGSPVNGSIPGDLLNPSGSAAVFESTGGVLYLVQDGSGWSVVPDTIDGTELDGMEIGPELDGTLPQELLVASPIMTPSSPTAGPAPAVVPLTTTAPTPEVAHPVAASIGAQPGQTDGTLKCYTPAAGYGPGCYQAVQIGGVLSSFLDPTVGTDRRATAGASRFLLTGIGAHVPYKFTVTSDNDFVGSRGELGIYFNPVGFGTEVSGSAFQLGEARVVVHPDTHTLDGNSPTCGSLYNSSSRCHLDYPSWILSFEYDGSYAVLEVNGSSQVSIATQRLPNSIAFPLPSPSPVRR